jgi:hypothetical protein
MMPVAPIETNENPPRLFYPYRGMNLLCAICHYDPNRQQLYEVVASVESLKEGTGIFQKTSAPQALINTYRMALLSAISSSLDSTFTHFFKVRSLDFRILFFAHKTTQGIGRPSGHGEDPKDLCYIICSSRI